tara:strand:- start:737 stop:934 length:198 start_codon:yes stop_codon:yes gene_type:complete
MDEFSIYNTKSGDKIISVKPVSGIEGGGNEEKSENPNKERIERLKSKIKLLNDELYRLESVNKEV